MPHDEIILGLKGYDIKKIEGVVWPESVHPVA